MTEQEIQEILFVPGVMTVSRGCLTTFEPHDFDNDQYVDLPVVVCSWWNGGWMLDMVHHSLQ